MECAIRAPWKERWQRDEPGAEDAGVPPTSPTPETARHSGGWRNPRSCGFSTNGTAPRRRGLGDGRTRFPPRSNTSCAIASSSRKKPKKPKKRRKGYRLGSAGSSRKKWQQCARCWRRHRTTNLEDSHEGAEKDQRDDDHRSR